MVMEFLCTGLEDLSFYVVTMDGIQDALLIKNHLMNSSIIKFIFITDHLFSKQHDLGL